MDTAIATPQIAARRRVRRRSSLVRRLSHAVGGFVVTAALILWFVLFSPTALGGRATYVFVSGTSMYPRLVNGDFVLMHKQRSYRAGDIVAYHIPKGQVGAGKLVIHRIIGGSPATGFLMRGDNRHTADDWRPRPSDVAGRLWLRVPGGARMVLMLRPFLLMGMAGLLTWLMIIGLFKQDPPDG
jgi:signal peptidase I